MREHVASVLGLLFLVFLGGKLLLLALILSLTALFYYSSVAPTGATTTAPASAVRTRRGKTRVITAPDLSKLKKNPDTDVFTSNKASFSESPVYIFYSSLTGASKKVATQLFETLNASGNHKSEVKMLSLDDDLEDLDSYFLNVPTSEGTKTNSTFPLYILILPSYESDSPIDYFLEFLNDTATDFRVDKYPLKALSGYTVLGLGDSESWPDLFCYQSKIADKLMSKLGARRIFPHGRLCVKNNLKETTSNWISRLVNVLSDEEPIIYEKNDPEDSDSDTDDGEEYSSDNDNENGNGSDEGTLVDMEDLSGENKTKGSGSLMRSINKKQMVAKNSPTFKSLTKQGYTVVGSHSGVKICRWTKSALRGRGFCYKFAFYGIHSHRCMETTPSLSCSNKCVFCWRHGTNPVGTTWRWEVDQPETIVEGALAGHYSKIKQMRGVPGVLMDRFEEAFKVRHCALSLVGEPIFYPYINEFLRMLHEKDISSFLVCNAQHPDQLRTLNKVTQLYVSIDAPTKQELKTVDRPLFRDYWERLEQCLDILRTVQSHQRTVFRLTLVKGFNMSESDVGGYADLVERGMPSLIEIKGATFCGSSEGNGNPLTMQNIPFYEECVSFVKRLDNELRSRGLQYGLAAEHAHSCCFLIASRQFYIDGKWHTHIDYDRFFELWNSNKSFTSLDYMCETPEWAYFGSKEGGFNPADTRYNRKDEKLKKKIQREQEKENQVGSGSGSSQTACI